MDIQLTTLIVPGDTLTLPLPTVETLLVPIDATTGTFRLAFPPVSEFTTTEQLFDVDPDPVTVQFALADLAGVSAVTVTKAVGNPGTGAPSVFTITFANGFAGAPAPLLEVVDSTVNGTAPVTTELATPGGVVSAGVEAVTVVFEGDVMNGLSESSRLLQLGPHQAL
jgi:hypothetical protein